MQIEVEVESLMKLNVCLCG